MVDKGAMIELRVDTGRITELSPLYQQTVVAGASRTACIVAPSSGEFRRLAEEVRDAIEVRTGTQLRVLDEADFAGAQHLPGNVIAVGHAANNQLIRSLHYLKCLDDASYPSEGLFVTSIHNPLGDGNNVLAALGYTLEAARNSVERLLECLVDRDGLLLAERPIKEIEPAPQTTEDAVEYARTMATADAEGRGGRPGSFLHALDEFSKAGDEAWARAFVTLATPYATGEIPLSFQLMSAVDFWTDALVVGWDKAEEFPFFSDDERLLIANFIASCTEYCNDSITYQKWRITDEEHQIFNHHTFPARGLYFGSMYLRRHGYEIADLDMWLDKALRVFARAAEAGRSFDEGGAGYSWLVGNHLLDVSLAGGDTSFAESGHILHYADLATMIHNSHFELVPYGDCGGYHTKGGGAATILLRAAEWHNDEGCKWVAEQTAPEATAADVLARHVGAQPPDEHVGMFVLPLDPVVWRWTGLPRFPNYPEPPRKPNVPIEQCFDKISLRGAWGPDADYLLLQGFGEGQHAHPDANAISQYQVRGRLFLAESDYIRRWPKQHNMVMVIRDGCHEAIPITARLDGKAEFSGGAMTQTSLLSYNGCDWTRTPLWLDGDCVIVIDTLTAHTAADYELRCYWRTLADTELTDAGMHTVHDGEHFHVIELTESERRLDSEPPPLNSVGYPEYRFGEAVPQVLCETQRVYLEPGEQACFVNLLLPTRDSAAPTRSIKWTGRGEVAVGGDGPLIAIGPQSIRIEGREEIAFADGPGSAPHGSRVAVAAGRLYSPRDPKQRSVPSISASQADVCWQAQLPATVTCMCATPGGGTLAGCEDGSIVTADESGALTQLAVAGDRVGAVLVGCIWGEAQATVMAASYDSTLRFLAMDGTERMIVELPRNSHMPAWGVALTLADLNGDGTLWPVVGTAAWRVHPITPEGELRWTFDTTAHSVTCLAAGDLNGDGRDELAVGTVYFCVPAATADGARLWQDEDYNDYWQAGPHFSFVHIADVDGDGELEVITVASDTLVHCIDHLGEKKWTRSIGDDPAGLVIMGEGIAAASKTGDVHLIDGQGKLLWRTRLDSPCTALARAGNLLAVAVESGRIVWLQRTGQPAATVELPDCAMLLLGHDDGGAVAATADGRLMLLKP